MANSLGGAPIPCHAFDLLEPLGSGGMAEVWRAEHRAQKTPVAIKVITARQARQSAYVDRFRREVQAVAGLNHPGIVGVFDYGQIPDEAASRHPRLVAGSPFLAMELMSGGSLASLPTSSSWADLRALLASMLDALAHAHARGVIHRDLKPANVLFDRRTDGRLTIKLADFGIAHALRRRCEMPVTNSPSSSVGTPLYMPPEQFEGRWRDFGPWTDLYALGAMAYEMASGHPPFVAENPVKLAIMHMSKAPPRMHPRFDVPAGFEEWVQRLLIKEPHARFERAADAARALAALPDCAPALRQTSPGLPAEAPLPRDPSHEDLADTLFEVVGETLAMPGVEALATQASEHAATEHLPREAFSGLETQSHESTETPAPETPSPLQVPPTWRIAGRQGSSVQLSGAGLGLFGLREIPMVDRDDERDLIWEALRRAVDEGRPRAVLLTGASGTGKSRLTDWMCTRADELGVATVLRASHSHTAAVNEGVAGMLEDYFACWGATREETRERVRAGLERVGGVAEQDPTHDTSDDVSALVELIRPVGETATAEERYRFSSPRERHAVVARLVRRLAGRRAVIIWLDEVQWSSESIALVEHVLRSDREMPVLFVLTARSEALGDDEHVAAKLDALAELPGCVHRDVGNLPSHYQLELVHEMLTLEPELAEQVVAHTGGNPLFAVQLVGDWVERGALSSSHRGYQLNEDLGDAVPATIRELVEARLARLIAGGPAEEGAQDDEALELAAALGMRVDADDWDAACRHAGLEVELGRLTEALVDSGLAERLHRGWSFAHGVVRQCLEARARREGRWQTHHAACAKMLEDRGGNDTPSAAVRLAEHWLEAGQPECAIGPLLFAATELVERGEHTRAQDLLDRREEALAHMEIGTDERAWSQGWVVRARSLMAHGPNPESLEYFDRVEHCARESGCRDLLAAAGHLRGIDASRRGDSDAGLAYFEQSRRDATAVGDQSLVAHNTRWIGTLRQARAEFELAQESFEQAMRDFERLADDQYHGEAHNELAYLCLQRGDLDGAEALLEQALAFWENSPTRNPLGLANTYNILGEVYRQRARPAEALAHYRRALRIYERTELDNFAHVTRLNIGLALVLDEQFAQAREVLEDVEHSLHAPTRAMCRLALLSCAADEETWDDWDRWADEAIAWFEEHEFFEQANAWAAEVAGERAASRGRLERARRVWELSERQWRAIGDTQSAARVADRIAALAK
ncbi:tetratricopeptide repeat protein [Persicimonas caeni]|uniref:Tetratricopeptide repeat protein n=1 Tax=Persicimonas caeni TaxID=2292766 RepID=A0A4Y6PZ99_PERCE|nr:tetratricopeptide repeat protein [Persicimonas caeni]QDG53648.1 tetratricopeptide repeat protein [Persicimonas caeni]QED34869.1 tetratricopeptide repeat protein [Persicimonas caeni]